MSDIRVRFAPSPTGFLHIGGARTALYNWLFARKNGGKLVLRIEDTDTERSTDESSKAIIEGLSWMGIHPDVGPYNQSEYLEEHKARAEQMVQSGVAYRCFCTKEELAAKREEAQRRKATYMYDGKCASIALEESNRRAENGESFVVRLRVNRDGKESVSFDDLVFGHIQVALVDIDDFVIVRTNGVPLYNLANVIDDHRDRISHILRGADGLTNTPKQVLIYEALGWDVPCFAHMALTLDPSKAKISKRRHGEVVAVEFYRRHGFLPWAFCNFLTLLGWSAGDDREIYEKPEDLIDAFCIERISKSNSIFNYRKGDPKFITDPKALVINGAHLRCMPLESLFPHVKKWLLERNLWNPRWDHEDKEWFLNTVDLIRERYHILEDFTEQGAAYFTEDYPITQKAMKRIQKDPVLEKGFNLLAERFEGLEEFTLESTEQELRALCDDMSVKPGLLINGVRSVVTGQIKGPGLFQILVTLGRSSVVRRLRAGAKLVNSNNE